MVINRIGDLRRVAGNYDLFKVFEKLRCQLSLSTSIMTGWVILGLRHRFDTEQPTLLDLELVNNRDRPSSNGGSGTRSNVNSTTNQDRENNVVSK